MAGVAQLVRALLCGSGGREFKSRHSPHKFYLISILCLQLFCMLWMLLCLRMLSILLAEALHAFSTNKA